MCLLLPSGRECLNFPIYLLTCAQWAANLSQSPSTSGARESRIAFAHFHTHTHTPLYFILGGRGVREWEIFFTLQLR